MQSVDSPCTLEILQCSFVCPWRLARNIVGIVIITTIIRKPGRIRKCRLNRSSYIINII